MRAENILVDINQVESEPSKSTKLRIGQHGVDRTQRTRRQPKDLHTDVHAKQRWQFHGGGSTAVAPNDQHPPDKQTNPLVGVVTGRRVIQLVPNRPRPAGLPKPVNNIGDNRDYVGCIGGVHACVGVDCVEN